MYAEARVAVGFCPEQAVAIQTSRGKMTKVKSFVKHLRVVLEKKEKKEKKREKNVKVPAIYRLALIRYLYTHIHYTLIRLHGPHSHVIHSFLSGDAHGPSQL